MAVLDASVFVDAIALRGNPGREANQVLGSEPFLHVPAMFVAEVLSALRSLVLHGRLTETRARNARRRLAEALLTTHEIDPFVARVWELRHNITVYDAWYVALAEARDDTLITADERLAAAAGPRCPVLTVSDYLAQQ